MDEKLLAAGGYFGRMFQELFGRRRMRRQLYGEISNNYYVTHSRLDRVTSIEGLAQGAALRFTDKLDLSFHVWEHYSGGGREDKLFSLKEAEAISRIYDKFRRIFEDLPGYPHVRAKEALAEIDDRLLDGSLDKRLYEKSSSGLAWHFMDDLLKGKRESWRKSLSPL